MEFILLSGAIGLGAACLALARRGGKRRMWAAPAVALLAITALIGGSGLWWYRHRALPAPLEEVLFEGVDYAREVERGPPPVIIHVVTIDLRRPGIRFLVTPPRLTGPRELAASTTSRFLGEHRVQVAINGDYFTPWYSRAPWDFYPREGDAVDILGAAVSNGRRHGSRTPPYDTMILARGTAILDEYPPEPENLLPGSGNAISGGPVILRDGEITAASRSFRLWDERHPRSAVAVDRAGERLLLVAIDGRQPNYSEGETLPGLAAIIARHGGWNALNLDGGGSTTLVAEGKDGRPRILNSPIHTRIPGRERPVANHLGVFAGRR